MTAILRETWALLSGWQKLGAGLVLAVIVIGGPALIAGNVVGWWKVSVAEARATAAEKRSDEYMKRAADMAAKIQKKEAEVAAVEEKRNGKATEVNEATNQVDRDRADYNRAVMEPRDDNPSAADLCLELAALDYPCTDAK